MSLFAIGDRVVALEDGCGESYFVKAGDEGTICQIGSSGMRYEYGVCWDDLVGDGHDCNGYCVDGYGRYVYEREITFAEQLPEINLDAVEGLL